MAGLLLALLLAYGVVNCGGPENANIELSNVTDDEARLSSW